MKLKLFLVLILTFCLCTPVLPLGVSQAIAQNTIQRKKSNSASAAQSSAKKKAKPQTSSPKKSNSYSNSNYNSPKATILSQSCKHNVENDGQGKMFQIHYDYNLKNLKGHTVRVTIKAYNSDGTTSYQSGGGERAYSTTFYVDENDFTRYDAWIGLYNETLKVSGKKDYHIKLLFYDVTSGRSIPTTGNDIFYVTYG